VQGRVAHPGGAHLREEIEIVLDERHNFGSCFLQSGGEVFHSVRQHRVKQVNVTASRAQM
jgi:hypothetical protein